MTTKIYLVTFTSYTGSDSFIYNDVEIFATEQEARDKFNYWADYAREECTWGSAFDSSEEERRENEDEPYDIDEQRGEDVYTVSSAAYEYYQVQVKLITKEITHINGNPVNFK